MSESSEQTLFVQWVRHYKPHLTIFHIPNGEKRHIITAKRLKAMGVLAGVPDLYIMELHLFIEMKTTTGKLTPSQLDFQAVCEKTNHSHLIAYGFTDAVEKLLEIVNKKRSK